MVPVRAMNSLPTTLMDGLSVTGQAHMEDRIEDECSGRIIGGSISRLVVISFASSYPEHDTHPGQGVHAVRHCAGPTTSRAMKTSG